MEFDNAVVLVLLCVGRLTEGGRDGGGSEVICLQGRNTSNSTFNHHGVGGHYI